MKWLIRQADNGEFHLHAGRRWFVFSNEADLLAHLRSSLGPADRVYRADADGYLVRDTSVGRRRHWRGR